MFDGVSRNPLYLQVAESIREAIIAGTLSPGDALPTERDLSESFGVSRASVREALRALQAQGLVSATGSPSRTVVVEGAGAHARDAMVTLLRLNGVGVEDLMALRAQLEGGALAAAARRRDDERLAEAREALEAMSRPGIGVEEFEEADVRFHVALVRASGNEAMHLVMQVLREAVARHLLDFLRAQPDLRATLARLIGEHAAILAAVERGHAARASALVDAHISGFYRAEPAPPPR
jgi:GntR family transcriptional regulator, transcriptional repressor for pyruvate dehydrogenase complex